jgi:hypothetical protein
MIDMNKLLESVKRHEGYRNKVYLDTLNKENGGRGPPVCRRLLGR